MSANLEPAAASLGGWEIVVVFAFVLILFAATFIPGFFRSRAAQNKSEELGERLRQDFVLWLAQGFGIGRIPFAPGTFGSGLGLLWFLLLVATGNLGIYIGGLFLGVALSIWLCGQAEGILKQTDPSSVVLDEIVAMPLCFLGWVGGDWLRHGSMPEPESFFTLPNGWRTALVFILFRLFDIVKPWPVRQSQRLHGGWGVTIDDLLAALYVAGLTLLWLRN